MSKRVITTIKSGGGTYPNVWSDFDWIAENRDALYEIYGRRIVLVYEKEVIGVGDTLEAATEDAEARLAPEIEQVTPVMYFLGPRHRITAIRITPSLCISPISPCLPCTGQSH